MTLLYCDKCDARYNEAFRIPVREISTGSSTSNPIYRVVGPEKDAKTCPICNKIPDAYKDVA